MVVFLLFIFLSISTKAHAGLSLSINGGHTYSRLERITSTFDSIILIDKSANHYGGQVNFGFSKYFEFYVDGSISNFDFDPPGTITLTDSKIESTSYSGGLRFKFSFGDMYLAYANRPLIFLSDVSASQLTLEVENFDYVDFGLHFNGKGEVFNVGAEAVASVMLSSAELNNQTVRTNLKMKGLFYLMFFGGHAKLYAGGIMTDYELNSDKYFQSEFVTGLKLTLSFSGFSFGGSDYDYHSFSIPRYPL